jgi:hypothetical protein
LLRQRRGAAGNGLGTTIKYLRRTTSGAAENSLGTMVKYLRQSTSGAAGNGLGVTIRYCDAQYRRRGLRRDNTIKYQRGAAAQ